MQKGSQLWRIVPKDRFELESINNFFVENYEKVDLWRETRVPGRPIDVMVSGDAVVKLRTALASLSTDLRVVIDDVEELIFAQQTERSKKRSAVKELKDLSDFDYTIYHTPDEVEEWMNMIVAEFTEVEKFQVGVTYEGRKINGLKIATNSTATNKQVVYVDALIHCREWITTASVMWTFHQILTDSTYANMKNNVDWFVIPMINIDGFTYTHTDNRLWRKTRSKGVDLHAEGCTGVDANRNWDYMWAGDGASPNPCDITYHGPMGFSESEVRHLSYFIENNKDVIKAVISVHSYGQYLLYPYNYALGAYPDNQLEHDTLGTNMKAAMFAINGTQYTHGQGAETIYVCSGVTTDWTAGVAGIDINFTFELRDLGEYGFLLPDEQIVPNAMELLAAFEVLVQHIAP